MLKALKWLAAVALVILSVIVALAACSSSMMIFISGIEI